MKPTRRSARSKRANMFLGSMATLLVIALVLFGVLIKAVVEIAKDLSIPSSPETGISTDADGGSSTTLGDDQNTTTTTTTESYISITTPLSCTGAVLYDVNTDTTLYARQADARCYPASLTKLLTAMTALKHCDASQSFTVGSELSLLQPNSSTAGLKAGNELTLTMLVDAMLVPSGNDAAYTVAVGVARHLFGGALSNEEAVAKFAKLMNETAKEIGAKNSHFVTPDGYYQSEHYSTPNDLLLITKAALDVPVIRESVAKPTARCVMLSGQDITWQNTNPLINQDNDQYMAEAIGVKSGYTFEGGYCASVAAVDGDKTVIGIVVNAPTSTDRWVDAAVLLEQGLQAK